MKQADNWIIIKIITEDKETYYKLLVSWNNNWKYRITGQIVDYYDDEDNCYFVSNSGTTYTCDRDGYGMANFVYGPIAYQSKKYDTFIPLDSHEAYKVVINKLWRT